MPEQLVTPALLAPDPRLAGLRRVAVVPAYNEAESIAAVVREVKGFDPEFEVVVVDDGSTDATARLAVEAGARVVRLPFNLGIGGAVQTGYQYARDHDFDLAVQVDGDGQHDPRQIPLLFEPILDGRADMVVGTRFAGEGSYRPPLGRRIGIGIFARVVSFVVGQRVTDTTSGFRACNRKAVSLFAADYPHDYPEVEGTILVFKHRLRLVEVPVGMRSRAGGRSSINSVRSVYYMVKVLLAIFIGLFRRKPTPLEER